MVETIDIKDINEWLCLASEEAIKDEFLERLCSMNLDNGDLFALADFLESYGYISVRPKYLQDEVALKEKIKELGL